MPEVREWDWSLKKGRRKGEEPKGEQKAGEGQGQSRKVTIARGVNRRVCLTQKAEEEGSRLKRKA